jgi:hypothetical protein
MKRINILLLACICSLLFASCQKELTMDSSLGLSGETASLVGNWKFIGLHSKTESIVELSDGIDVLKTITLSEYYSKNNTGTIVIDDSKMTGTNVGFEVDTIARGFMYENNVLIDTLSAPFSFIAPITNSVSPYVRVSQDSLYFTGGQFALGTGAATPGSPIGVRFQFKDDKVLLTYKFTNLEVEDVLGLRQTKKQSALTVITYQKQ